MLLALLLLLPADFVLADEERFLRGIAGAAGVEISIRGSRLPLEVHGSGDLRQIEAFVTDLSKRPVDLTSLHVGRDGRFVLRYDAATPSRSQRFDEALALFAAISDDPAVRVTELAIGEKRLLRGVVAGAAARARVAKVPGVQLAPTGACRAFALGAPPADDSLCAVSLPPTLSRIEVRGKGGPITLNLREAAIADFFLALHEITGQNFVLAPDVRGLVNVNVENATLDEVLRATGLTVAGTRLRRVSRAPTRDLTQEYTGDPINLQLRNADFAAILCLFQEVTGIEMSIAEPYGRPSIFTSELPWDLALEGLVATSGFTYAIDGTKMFVGPEPAVKERRVRRACEITASSPARFADLHLKLEQLGRDDLTVAGVVRKGDKWTALAYGPMRQLFLVVPGQTLFDARVKTVGAAGVVFEPLR